MKLFRYIVLFWVITLLVSSCMKQNASKEYKTESSTQPFMWNAATVYFLLTDRFYNGDTTNDVNFNRTAATGKLRNFEGGDIKGITQKLKSGYFNKLGVNVIWINPVVEQIHGVINEGTGGTYGFHGYWTKDWTSLDPNFGTELDLKEMIQEAHKQGIRVLLDAVINHTGPVTNQDQVWPKDWVRVGPPCNYRSYESTVFCTLTKNLPDVRTESNSEVDLPSALVEKWKKEGRYEQEVEELDEFFSRTGYKRAPRYYIMKWLSDYVRKYGIDGYRIDTVKHVESSVWADFIKICQEAFDIWKKNNPDEVLDNNSFFTVGEVYGYNIHDGEIYNYGDSSVNFFKSGFNSLINFSFIYDSKGDIETMFSIYSNILNNSLKGYTVFNYLSSHDDSNPYDSSREKGFDAANKLLLAPGVAQIYYGDESNRPLIIDGTEGDATLRSKMNWDEISNDKDTKELLAYWQKLGVFRKEHPAIGAGVHMKINNNPYAFGRILSEHNNNDRVIVALDLNESENSIKVTPIFKNGDVLINSYTGEKLTVVNGEVIIKGVSRIALISYL